MSIKVGDLVLCTVRSSDTDKDRAKYSSQEGVVTYVDNSEISFKIQMGDGCRYWWYRDEVKPAVVVKPQPPANLQPSVVSTPVRKFETGELVIITKYTGTCSNLADLVGKVGKVLQVDDSYCPYLIRHGNDTNWWTLSDCTIVPAPPETIFPEKFPRVPTRVFPGDKVVLREFDNDDPEIDVLCTKELVGKVITVLKVTKDDIEFNTEDDYDLVWPNGYYELVLSIEKQDLIKDLDNALKLGAYDTQSNKENTMSNVNHISGTPGKTVEISRNRAAFTDALARAPVEWSLQFVLSRRGCRETPTFGSDAGRAGLGASGGRDRSPPGLVADYGH